MNPTCIKPERPSNLAVFLSPAEKDALNRYLRDKGLKKHCYVRMVIAQALEKEGYLAPAQEAQG